AVEMAEQHRLTICRTELVHRSIEQRSHAGPVGVLLTRAQNFVHSESRFFACAGALSCAHEFRADESRRRVKPTRHRGMVHEAGRTLREREKYALRGVPCGMGITAELAQRGRIDEVDMALNERPL